MSVADISHPLTRALVAAIFAAPGRVMQLPAFLAEHIAVLGLALRTMTLAGERTCISTVSLIQPPSR